MLCIVVWADDGIPDFQIDPKRVPNPLELPREPKASRIRVFAAVERIVRFGRRPTVEGVRELLGGGSPNSVTAYINDWYKELGNRLAAAETPMPGLPPDAVWLLAELWRVATDSRAGTAKPSMAADELRDAERVALVAETKALDTLNKELQKHRASAERSLAEARALLARREAAIEEERENVAALDQALAQTRLELEVVLERQRLAPARVPAPTRIRSARTRRKPARQPGAKASRTPLNSEKSRRAAKTLKRAKRPSSPNRRRTKPTLMKRK